MGESRRQGEAKTSTHIERNLESAEKQYI